MQITPGTDSAHKTSVAFARIDADGRANYEFDLNWAVPQLPDLEPFGHLHTGSIAATVEPGGSTVVVAAERMRLLGTVSYDPNIRPALMHSPDTVVDRVEHLVSLSDVVKTSDEDLDWLYPGVPVENIMRRWVKTGPAMVVVTRGSWGAYARLAHNRDMLHIDQTPVTVGDTVGAGDSFMAGLISGLLDAGLLGSPQARDRLAAADWPDVQPALLRAIHTSALTVSRSGAYAPPGPKCMRFTRSTRPSPERSSRSPRTPCLVTGVDAQPHSREESPDVQLLFLRHSQTPATSAANSAPGDLGGGIDAGHVAGEAAHHGHPPRPHRTGGIGIGTLHPLQGHVDGDRRDAGRVEAGDEAGKQSGGLIEPVSQGSTQPQVLFGLLGERAHRRVPGQGWATVRNTARSTLA